MASTDSGVIDALNDLLTGARDGQQNYRDAAEAVTRPDIKAALTAYANAGASRAAEFEAEVRRLGGDPESGGKLEAKAHRALQHLKGAVSGQDDSAILSEVESGLDAAERTHAMALRHSLGAETRALVERSWGDVRRQHDEVAEWLRQDPGAANARRAES